MPINSRAKGKRGELEAVKYLKYLGFHDARRTQQYNGLGRGDVECPETLPGVHIEVKYGYPIKDFDLGTQALDDACTQAWCDAKTENGFHVVLWKPKNLRQWRMTFWDEGVAGYATVANDRVISDFLKTFMP